MDGTRDKFIPYESIVAVQFQAMPFGTEGYLQLSLRGGSEAKSGLLQSHRDENTIRWAWLSKSKTADFAEARDLILRESRPNRLRRRSVLSALNDEVATRVCRFCGYRFAESAP